MREQAGFTSETVAIQEVFAERLAGVMAEPAVCPRAVSCGQEVLAHDIALLLSSWGRRSEGWVHGFANEISGLVLV